jgi:uncharacterized coiled-coil DUF342 family protein
MSLAIAPQDPRPYLTKERDALATVMDELEQNIEKTINQLQSLRAVYDAVNNELEKLGPGEQLELPLE